MKKNSNLNVVLEAWRLLRPLASNPNCPKRVVSAVESLVVTLVSALASDDSLYITEYPKKN